MPPIIPFIPAIIGGIGAISSGIGASKKRTSTQTGLQTEDQQGVSSIIAQMLKQFLGAGPNVDFADRAAARGSINKTYDSIRPRLEAQLTARGFAGSGKEGASFKSLETDRAGAIQQSDTALRQEAMQRFLHALGLGENFIRPFSSSTTQPGAPWQSSLGAGLSDLSGLLYGGGLSGGRSEGGSYFSNPASPYYVPPGPPPCWIAMACYGRNDWRVLLVRRWLAAKTEASVRWRALIALYVLAGRPVAAATRRSKFLTAMFRGMFDRIVYSAVGA